MRKDMDALLETAEGAVDAFDRFRSLLLDIHQSGGGDENNAKQAAVANLLRASAYLLCEIALLEDSQVHRNALRKGLTQLLTATESDIAWMVSLQVLRNNLPLPTCLAIEEGRLTSRERSVIMLVLWGLTNQEIAEELYVSPKTVEFHLTNIYSKLDVTSRKQLRRLLTGTFLPSVTCR